ncbi:helix-turn-helix transcriptional regulator [Coraliomargarita sp. W4R72]
MKCEGRDLINVLEAPSIRRLSRAVHGGIVAQDSFQLADLWQLHFYEYSGTLEVAGHSFDLQPGSVSLVPPGPVVAFTYQGPSEHLYCHFSLEDAPSYHNFEPYYFEPEIRLARLKHLLAEALSFQRSDLMRANIRLWDVLLGLNDVYRQPQEGDSHSQILDRATNVVELEMAKGLHVAELADRCEVTHHQLIRIFRAHLNCTPAAWLRQKRCGRAHELLCYSDLPIKVIAFEVGMPDLQYFNKVMRRLYGGSPRDLRKQALLDT